MELIRKYEFWIFLVIGFILVFFGFQIAHGADFIYSLGGTANTYTIQNTAGSNIFSNFTITSTTIPAPLSPFKLDRVLYGNTTSTNHWKAIEIILNGSSTGFRNNFADTPAGYDEKYHAISFLDLNLLINPFDVLEVRFEIEATGYGSGGPVALLSDTNGSQNTTANGYAGDISDKGVFLALFSSVPTSTISIQFPYASSTIPDFTNWIISASSTGNSYITIYYFNDNLNLTYYDEQYYGSFMLDGRSLLIPKTIGRIVSGDWRAFASLRDPVSGATTYSNAVYFTIGNAYAIPAPTSTISQYAYRDNLLFDENPLLHTTSTEIFDLATCANFDISSSTLSSISCYVSNFFKEMINQIAGAVSSLFSSIGYAITHTFPINILNHVITDFDVASQATSTADIVLSSTNPKVFGGNSYTILTSTTVSTISGNVGFNFRDFVSKVIYLFTGLLMVFQVVLIVGHLKKERQNNA